MAYLGYQSNFLGLPSRDKCHNSQSVRRTRYVVLKPNWKIIRSCSLLIEYWLSSLKVATVVIFILVGIVVNCGGNVNHEYIGGKYWNIPGAPFVGGFGGFARVFVTASFACRSIVYTVLLGPNVLFSRWWDGELGHYRR
jgi:hypothetical protein